MRLVSQIIVDDLHKVMNNLPINISKIHSVVNTNNDETGFSSTVDDLHKVINAGDKHDVTNVDDLHKVMNNLPVNISKIPLVVNTNNDETGSQMNVFLKVVCGLGLQLVWMGLILWNLGWEIPWNELNEFGVVGEIGACCLMLVGFVWGLKTMCDNISEDENVRLCGLSMCGIGIMLWVVFNEYSDGELIGLIVLLGYGLGVLVEKLFDNSKEGKEDKFVVLVCGLVLQLVWMSLIIWNLGMEVPWNELGRVVKVGAYWLVLVGLVWGLKTICVEIPENIKINGISICGILMLVGLGDLGFWMWTVVMLFGLIAWILAEHVAKYVDEDQVDSVYYH